MQFPLDPCTQACLNGPKVHVCAIPTSVSTTLKVEGPSNDQAHCMQLALYLWGTQHELQEATATVLQASDVMGVNDRRTHAICCTG